MKLHKLQEAKSSDMTLLLLSRSDEIILKLLLTKVLHLYTTHVHLIYSTCTFNCRKSLFNISRLKFGTQINSCLLYFFPVFINF